MPLLRLQLLLLLLLLKIRVSLEQLLQLRRTNKDQTRKCFRANFMNCEKPDLLRLRPTHISSARGGQSWRFCNMCYIDAMHWN